MKTSTALFFILFALVASGCRRPQNKPYVMIIDNDANYRYVYCDSFQMVSSKEVIIWDGKTKQTLKASRSITPESN